MRARTHARTLAALGEFRSLCQPHWESDRHSPGRTKRLSDTLPPALGECPTLSQLHWESIRYFPSRIGRVSDTLPATLGVCPILSQPHWESVGRSPSRIGRVSDALPVRLGECQTLRTRVVVWRHTRTLTCTHTHSSVSSIIQGKNYGKN